MTQARDFRDRYQDALRGYLLAGGEGQLRLAYELGRQAVSRELSVLELSDAHHDALVAAVASASDPRSVRRVIDAGRDFFRESLSAYEMVQRGFRDARDGALTERRHAGMLRQLSDLLADGSLALDGSGSLAEMALLLAEQARELCAGDACLVTVAAGDAGGEVGAVAHDGEARAWQALLDDSAVRRLPELTAPHAKSLRLDGAELSSRIAFQRLAIESAPARSLRGWLVAPLTSLDGGRLGAIQVFTTRGSGFGELDEQVAIHLAQLASAALERRGWPRGPD